MQTCQYAGDLVTGPRSHPWSDATTSAAFRYLDLKAEPALIRTALEDFVPWSHEPAIDAVYQLLEWLNGADSALESSDCAFTGPHPNDAAAVPAALQCTGRIIIMFRALARNLSRQRITALRDGLHRRLDSFDRALALGMIGTTIVPVQYMTLAAPAAEQHGFQLMISFWAWGDSEREVMANLRRVVSNLSRALGARLRS